MSTGRIERDDATELARHTNEDLGILERMGEYYAASHGTDYQKLKSFTKYVHRQELTCLLSKYEMFKQVREIQGSIVECGVYAGAGLMSWAQLSSIFEPMNFQRKIIGFDTFEGFPELSQQDLTGSSSFLKPRGLAADSYEDLLKCIELYDSNRFLGHIPKVELVKGDAVATIPQFIKDNPYIIVSLLYLDFDLYEPTKAAIQNFLPRMPKGAIIAFDELNDPYMPGETMAVLDELNLRNLKIRRFDFEPKLSYAVLD